MMEIGWLIQMMPSDTGVDRAWGRAIPLNENVIPSWNIIPSSVNISIPSAVVRYLTLWSTKLGNETRHYLSGHWPERVDTSPAEFLHRYSRCRQASLANDNEQLMPWKPGPWSQLCRSVVFPVLTLSGGAVLSTSHRRGIRAVIDSFIGSKSRP